MRQLLSSHCVCPGQFQSGRLHGLGCVRAGSAGRGLAYWGEWRGGRRHGAGVETLIIQGAGGAIGALGPVECISRFHSGVALDRIRCTLTLIQSMLLIPGHCNFNLASLIILVPYKLAMLCSSFTSLLLKLPSFTACLNLLLLRMKDSRSPGFLIDFSD